MLIRLLYRLYIYFSITIQKANIMDSNINFSGSGLHKINITHAVVKRAKRVKHHITIFAVDIEHLCEISKMLDVALVLRKNNTTDSYYTYLSYSLNGQFYEYFGHHRHIDYLKEDTYRLVVGGIKYNEVEL